MEEEEGGVGEEEEKKRKKTKRWKKREEKKKRRRRKRRGKNLNTPQTAKGGFFAVFFLFDRFFVLSLIKVCCYTRRSVSSFFSV
jgi:hypothetical protein